MKLNHSKGLMWLGAVGFGSIITILAPTWLFITGIVIVGLVMIYLLGATS